MVADCGNQGLRACESERHAALPGPESTELWSPGSPIFPSAETAAREEPVKREVFLRILEARGNREK